MRRALMVVAVAAVLAACGSNTPAVNTSVSPTSSASSSGPASTASSSATTTTSTTSSASTTSTPASSSSAATTSSAAQLSGTLTIYAATSLKAAFTQLAALFTTQHPGVTVNPITFDGSSTLATQLVGGAAGDIFASADDKNMKTVVDAGLVAGAPAEFATNTLQIAVKPGNPLGVTGLADVVKPEVSLVLCDDAVPCGSAAQKAFAAAGLTANPVSKEQNVGAVLTKVATGGDADAGLVYRTDIKNAAAGTVQGIDFPESSQAVNNYPIAVLGGSTNAAAAQAFAALVTSAEGQQILADLGFAPPPGR